MTKRKKQADVSVPPELPDWEDLGVRSTSLGALEKVFFKFRGQDSATLFSQLYSRELADNYYIHLRPESGKRVTRTDAVDEVKSVGYEEFDPPGYWQQPYQLMRVRVTEPKPDIFYYHDGEEIVVPIDGPGVKYDFFWAEPDSRQLPDVYPARAIHVKVGSAIRIQPQIPHRAWGAGHAATRGWMLTRPLANAAGQIYVASQDRITNQASSRQISEKDIRRLVYGDASVKTPVKPTPGGYALIAWGIADEIRQKRLRIAKSIADVASACKIDAGHLSKIEKGQTNVSFDTLLRINKFLDLDVERLLAPPMEAECVATVDAEVGTNKPLFPEPTPRFHLAEEPVRPKFLDHYVHPCVWRFDRNMARFEEPLKYEYSSTWIMISGCAVFEIGSSGKRWKGANEILNEESVLHLRGRDAQVNGIQPLEECVMLQVVFDPECCRCGKRS